MNLSELVNGQEGVIVKVKGYGAFRRRILEMGFVKGKRVTVIKNAPLRDPIEYNILDYQVSLRRSEADLIEVVTMEDAETIAKQPYFGTIDEDVLSKTASEKRKVINVALVGNPNCGKTTIFNNASGLNEHVGNYSGVTVDVKTGTFNHKGYTFHVSDLPGTYSLSTYSPEEVYVRDHISNQMPDVIINVLDASNLERNLYLTTQLIHMDVKVVIALNMFDDLQKRGNILDYKHLGNMLGMPFIPTVGSRNRGIIELLDKVIEVYEDQSDEYRPVRINFGEVGENAIDKIEQKIKEYPDIRVKITPRFLTIKLLEKDQAYRTLVELHKLTDVIAETDKQIIRIEHLLKEDIETIITDTRYGFIAGALKETYKENPRKRRRKTDMIDNFITHKLFGFPIFFFFMWVMFQSTFTLGKYPMEWIDAGVTLISNFFSTHMPEGPFKDLILDGIIGGVGGVIVFLPNILILFFFISFMEDTGYMARAAFIMDKVMHKIGLHGKSFIPLIMGFGCNVPAIMATRTIEDRNSRLLTILINPFMSCSARLPVYILFIAAFFPHYPGTILFILYGTGILIAILISRLFKRIIFKKNDLPFVMELPPYRLPTIRTTTLHMWNKGQQYLRKMGGIIMVASIIIWFLGYYPRKSIDHAIYQNQLEMIAHKYDSIYSNTSDSFKISQLKVLENNEAVAILDAMHLKQQEDSYIGRIGHFIEPAIKPLGFDWKMGISLLSGIAAKEIVISTMSVIYQSEHKGNNDNKQLITNMQNDKYSDGTPVFSQLVSMSFLLFTLIYFPCIAVIAAIKKESGSWKWALFTIFYTTTLAWIVAFGFYQIGGLFV